jgi:hypothetical protein
MSSALHFQVKQGFLQSANLIQECR